MLSGSVAELPRALLEQLKVGGRLVAIVGDEPVMPAVLVTRRGADGFEALLVDADDTAAICCTDMPSVDAA